MTTAEQIKSISDQMRELREKRAELIEVRKTESEFKVGEKVKVYKNYGYKEVCLGEGFVSGIIVDTEDGDFDYQFNKVKKDGTASKNYMNTRGKVRLEKL